MRKIEAEALEKIKNKYGINKLRKYANLYGVGIPEKYWDTKPTDKQLELIDDILLVLNKHNNLVIYCQNVITGNRIASEMLKRLGIQNARYLDFVNIANEMVDKFGQMNMNLLTELGNEDTIVISNIKPYGQFYMSRVYPLFASFLNGLYNGVLSKKIVLVIEHTDDDLDNIDKSYGDELANTLHSIFNFYQLPSWINDEKD